MYVITPGRRIKVLFLTLLLLSVGVVDSALAQGGNGIESPRDNAVVSGVVIIEGTAIDPDFLRYELAFFKEFDPAGDWVVFFTGDAPVGSGILTTWDTTIGRDAGSPFYPDGTYRLRLRVVRRDSNYQEYYVLGLSLANDQPTPTPSGTPEAETSPLPTAAILVPTELPTLTPFPTATPRPTAEGSQEVSPVTRPPADEKTDSLLQLEGEFDVEQVKGGLVLGAKIALVFFLGLLVYILVRKSLRIVLTRARSWNVPARIAGLFSRRRQ